MHSRISCCVLIVPRVVSAVPARLRRSIVLQVDVREYALCGDRGLKRNTNWETLRTREPQDHAGSTQIDWSSLTLTVPRRVVGRVAVVNVCSISAVRGKLPAPWYCPRRRRSQGTCRACVVGAGSERGALCPQSMEAWSGSPDVDLNDALSTTFVPDAVRIRRVGSSKYLQRRDV